MPAIQYPFIDIAVHPRVRERFARGEAMALFSTDMRRVLWANGSGADLFGHAAIYDFLEQGPNSGDVSFRQVEATARGLKALGDQRSFLIRMTAGFQRVVVNAAVELIRTQAGEQAVLFSAPVASRSLTPAEGARHMIEGFDDPDTHMAVIGRDGDIIASSKKFGSLGITPQTVRMLVTMAGAQPERLIKRPIPTGQGYLPAAIGKLSEVPPLHLLFVVEAVMDHFDPVDQIAAEASALLPAAIAEEAPPSAAAAPPEDAASSEGTSAPSAYVINAIAEIEEVDDAPRHADEAAAVAGVDDHAEDLAALAAFDWTTQKPDSVADGSGEPLLAQMPETAPAEPRTGVAEVAEGQTEGPQPSMTAAAGPAVEPKAGAEHQPPATDDPAQSTAGHQADGAVNELTERTPEQLGATVDPRADGARHQRGEAAAEESFAFKHNGRATRFVWKIDAEGRFSEISHEFANAVGPRAAKVTGEAFSDVAARFNLDPEGKIARLLAKRDTWSGRTIHWPIEGTGLMVPVDLAALPTYTRNREFDGFRGFGVVRLSDAVEDPAKAGLALGSPAEPTGKQDRIQNATASEPAAASAEGTQHPSAETDGHRPKTSAPEPNVPPELPALAIADTPKRRISDKIIRLHEHRPPVRDGLSASEQAAFREIARQLEPFGKRVGPPTDVPVEGNVHATVETADDIEMRSEASSSDQAHAVRDGEAEAKGPEQDADENRPAEPVGETLEPDQDFNPLDVLSTVIPPRAKATSGLDADMVDLLPVAVLIHAGDRLIHANPEFLRLTGYGNLAALEGVGGLDALMQPHDLDGPSDRAGTVMVVRADDALVPVTARLQSIRWEEGSALMLALMPVVRPEAKPPEPAEVRDDARSGRMVEKVAKLQVEVEELQSILETATDGVVVIGPDGDIRSMNRSASALFNYDDQETRGRPFVMLFAHESQKAVLDYLSGLSGYGVASVLNDGREVIGREASGGFVPLFMTMGRLTSSNGYCAVIRDITQWKRTEEELRSAKRAAETANAHKSDFLARVSHEIRTPLNAIIGFSDMMTGERFGPIGHARYIEYANDIGRSGRHVLDIVNDLLDISKIEAGEMDLEFAAVDLNEAIAEAASLVQPQANSQRVIIRTALSQSVPNVVADLRSIKQIALNILSNAIRFTPSGGQIVVSTSYEANGSVAMRIRDTGTGMTRSELEQAMKPFRQVSASGRARGDGTGLGLPLTKAMVDANRAMFAIHSAPNEGTLVEITFPSQRVLAD
jgi:PAS domain S-box-containing protein